MTALALEHGAVNLGQGFPDFSPPDFVLEAAQTAFSSNLHQYAPPRGHARLQHALSANLESSLGFTPDPESEVTIAVGATQAIDVWRVKSGKAIPRDLIFRLNAKDETGGSDCR